MKCPTCHKDTISFWKMWITSGLGVQHCWYCGEFCKARKHNGLTAIAGLFGGFAGAAGVATGSWVIFFTILSGGLILEILLETTQRKLEVVTFDKPVREGTQNG